MDAKMTDNVNSPSHYARYRFECEPKDLTKYLPHPLASAIEYILRAPFKGNEIEDLKKARFWLREFKNTDGFWQSHPQGSGNDQTDFCKTLCDGVTRFEAIATACGVLGRCPILRDILLGRDYRPVTFPDLLFPMVIYRCDVNLLILELNAAIDKLESKPSA